MKRRDFLGWAALAAAAARNDWAHAAPEPTQPFTWSASGLKFSFDFYERSLRQRFILPADALADVESHLAPFAGHAAALADTSASRFDSLCLEVALHCSGEDSADHHGMKFTAGMPGLRLVFQKRTETTTPNGKRLALSHIDPVLKLQVESFYDAYDGLPVVRRYTRVENQGSQAVGIEYLSSAMLSNFASPDAFEDELRIHVCLNSWQAEGQWHSWKPSELGLVQNGEFSVSAAFLGSLGTWSTERYLPMALIENRVLRLTWFWQIEYNGSWHAELSQTSAKALYAYIGGPDEQHAHAWKNLRPGESYQTVPVSVGCVNGGFGEAVEQLTRYRREIRARRFQARNRSCPVIFNDAVALDLDPTTEKELPLIDAAAALGCEYYVLDAGWYAEKNENWWGVAGNWEPSKSRWPGGFEPVLKHVRDNGMIAGLWLEPEVAGLSSALAHKPDDWFFVRHGKRVIDHGRYLLDFRNREVRAYLDAVVNRCVGQYGIEYLKLDYNVDGLEGTELHADSFGQGLHEHNLALLEWLEGVVTRFPRLIVENCASGGGRLDYAMLALTQLESASDQDDYRRYPALVTGLSAGLVPEQLGVWSFPSANATADEASFNMVNAMLCRIHISGNLTQTTAAARVQLKTGIEVYKTVLRQTAPESIPFYPLGMPDMTNEVAPIALGMRSKSSILMAIWRREGPAHVEIAANPGSCDLLYPRDLNIRVGNKSGRLAVTFPRINMGCIVRVRALA